jgi:hypothetical protein
MSEEYQCGVCGKVIRGEHLMTIKDEWIKKGGHGTPPPTAIVHLCSETCAKQSKEVKT